MRNPITIHALGLGRVMLLVALLCSATNAAAATAPDWTLKTTDGSRVRFSKLLDDGPVLLSFWALWCVPCLKELPHMDQLAQEFEDRVSVLAINTDTQRSLNKVRPFLRSKGYEITVPLDTAGELGRKLQVGDAIPFVVLYDADGREVYRHTGYKEGDEVALKQEIEKLLAKKSGETR